MKSIRKLTENSFSSSLKALTGSALLVGATLTGAASFASASSHDSASMDLGDYPQPFVTEDGEVQTSIVLGSDAAVTDVVGATEIAGSLGNAAFTETQVSTEGSSGSWTASDGVTLDSSNTNLYFGDAIDSAKSTLTNEDLDILSTTQVFSGDQEQDVEQYLYVGSQQIQFGNPSGEDQDPFLYVNNPAEPSTTSGSSNWLYKLQANFQDGVVFEDGDSERNSNVYDQEVEMFGQTFTVAQDSFTGNSKLILFQSQNTQSVSAGESVTMTIGGEETTVSMKGINSNNEAVLTIDGESYRLAEDESESIKGEEVRVSSLNNFDPQDDLSDNVELSVGSGEIVLQDGQPVMTGSDEEEVDGTYVSLSGSGLDQDASDSNDDTIELSNIEVAVGADDSDNSYVRAEESFQDPVFDNLEFQFGGLNPDASGLESSIDVSPSDDREVSVSFDKGDSSRTVQYTDYTGSQALADSDGNKIVAVEGNAVTQDEYFAADAGDHSHLYEVTEVDRDAQNPSSGDEATIELEDKATDQQLTVDLDPDSGTDDYVGTEVINGQTYHFHLDGAGESDDTKANLYAAWGTDAAATDSGINTGSGSSGVTTAFPTIETENGARIAFYAPSQDPSGLSLGTSLVDFQSNEFFVDSSSQSTEGSNGYGDGDQITRVINNHDGSLEAVGGDGIDAFSSSARFYDKDGSGGYNAGDEVYQDQDSDNFYTGTTDTLVAGTGPSNGASITDANNQDSDWAIDSIDANDGGAWSSSSDTLHEDEDQDDAYTAQADQVIDSDGTTSTTDYGSSSDMSAGDTVTAYSVAKGNNMIYYVDDGTTDGQYDADDDVYFSGSNGVETTDDLISQGNNGATASYSATGDAHAFGAGDNIAIEGADSTYSDGEDVVVDYHSGGTYSASADTVVAGATPSDGETGAQYTAGGFDNDWSLDSYDSSDGASWNSNNDAIVIDTGDRGTYSDSTDTVINQGADGTTDVSDGDTASNNDLDENTYFSVDVDGNGIDSGDEVVTEVEGDLSDDQTIKAFSSTVKHSGSQPFDTSESVVDDTGSNTDAYDSGDTLFGSTSGNVRYWSSDSSETNGVSGLNSQLPSSTPGLVVIEEKDEDDAQESYVLTSSWDSGDSELDLDTPSFTDSGKRTVKTLDSDDNVDVAYSHYGSYTSYDSDGQGEFEFFSPAASATAGAAFTGSDGSVSSTGSGSVTADSPSYSHASGLLTSDTDEVESAKTDDNLILVGGPNANSLTQELVEDNQTMAGSEYTDGQGVIQMVDGFSEGNQALVVAGYSGEDTRNAAEFLADYRNNEESLEGQSEVTIETSTNSVVQ